MTAERLASNVAFATEVSLIDQCQNERSPVKLRPTARSAMACGLSGRVVRVRRDSNAQIQSAGAASATRQNADVIGPTSARRTKIGEKPIAVAPRISAPRLSVVRFGGERAGMLAGEDSMAPACGSDGVHSTRLIVNRTVLTTSKRLAMILATCNTIAVQTQPSCFER